MRVAILAAALAAVSCVDRGVDAPAQAGPLSADAPSATTSWAPLATGGSHTCTVARRGARCWGFNAQQQLNAPALRHPVQLVAGNAHSCALDDDGVKCWGSNSSQQSAVPPLRNPRQITAGTNHTCALDDDGVKCWGNNTSLQTTVPAGLREPKAVAVGGSHSCAIDADGVKCWGKNTNGQATPPVLRNPMQISLGDAHSCAVDESGVVCWGLNTSQQTTVPPLRLPSQVVGGASHTCALDADGVKCWGSNFANQATVPPLHRPSFIAAGRSHTCAIDDDDVVCWGSNTSGQVTSPADLELVGRHACVVAQDGLRCAGDNERGQLGVGSDVDRIVAFNATASSDLGAAFGVPAQIAIGAGFACARSAAGAVKCWGKNTRGQLGLGDTRDRGAAPAEMGDALPSLRFDGASPAKKIALGQDHACAIDGPGQLWCWGKGSSGQLGTETGDDVRTPTRAHLKAGFAARDVALGRRHTCVLGRDGAVYCFGANDAGQLGLGHTAAVGDRPATMGDAMRPVALGDGFRVKALTSGEDHVCAVATDGRIKCWGKNAVGQLGLGDTRDRGAAAADLGAALPVVDVGHGQAVVDLSCGKRHCCARMVQNTMKCWGDNADGQLGLGDLAARGTDASSTGDNLPFLLTPPLERVLGIEAVADRTCARTDSGLRCWGRNGAGELGYGDREPRGGSLTTVPRVLAPLGI
jgi:alpha-tubulin suppressor-like RCC1 family protein